MTPQQQHDLVEAFSRQPYRRVGRRGRGWTFEYDFPGAFSYVHDSGRKKVYFLPSERPGDNTVSIQVYEAGSNRPVQIEALPFHSDRPTRRRSHPDWHAQGLFDIVRPYLVLPGRKDWDPRGKRMGATAPERSSLTDEEEQALVDAFQRSPFVQYGNWSFDYEHPGFFVYVHTRGKRVYFTPDFNEPGDVDIQIVKPGDEEPSSFVSIAYPQPLIPRALFQIVQPFLIVGRSPGGRKDWDPRREPQRPDMSGRKDWDPRPWRRAKAELPSLSDEAERALREAFSGPTYRQRGPWGFEYEYPGYFVYTHDDTGRRVYFTPDSNEPGYVDIQLVEPGDDKPSWVDEVLYPTPLTPAGLYHIVERYLPQQGGAMSGRKDWDPRRRRRGTVLRAVAPNLQDFLDAYLEAALWAESDPATEEPLDKDHDTRDIAPDTMEKLLADAFDFIEQNHEDIGSELARAGHDFWLTRQGHGAGFWDGDWPEPAASRLTRNAERFGQVTLVVGDDRKIHAL